MTLKGITRILSLVTMALGLSIVFFPAFGSKFFLGFDDPSLTALGELAGMGGVFVVFGALALWGSLIMGAGGSRWIIPAGIMYLGFAAGRLTAALLLGYPNVQGWVFLGMEVATGALLLIGSTAFDTKTLHQEE